MTQPYFFVFDGVDGAGKTTQIRRFKAWLEAQGQTVEICRDPGSSELGERIRELLLQSTDVPIGNRAEMLLYMAARAQLVDQIIRPALEQRPYRDFRPLSAGQRRLPRARRVAWPRRRSGRSATSRRRASSRR